MHKALLTVLLLVSPALAQPPLTLHWLVREDIFSGLMAGDVARLEKGEQTLNELGRFYSEPQVIAWRAAIDGARAGIAAKANRMDDFRRHYSRAITYFDQLRRMEAKDPEAKFLSAVFEGGVFISIADLVPENLRANAWERTYASYVRLNELEKGRVLKMPNHMRGEILGGLAESAFRTNRTTEGEEALKVILANMPNTPYANVAQKWTENPALRTKLRMGCISCHEQNTLKNLLAKPGKAE